MNRVVITGLGVVYPGGMGVSDFQKALENGISGIKLSHQLQLWNQGCQLAGVPEIDTTILNEYFEENTLKALRSTAVIYGLISAIHAWKDAGFEIDRNNIDWDTGCVFGATLSDFSLLKEMISKIDNSEFKKLGTRFIEQIMFSGISAYISGLIGLGNQSTSNSSACATGTESLIMAYERIKNGFAKKMICGSSEGANPHVWAACDAMGILNRKSNDNPSAASRPMSSTASGFIPGAGAGAFVLEELNVAKERGARIYAEIVGGAITCGGQRNGGSMTAPNSEGVRKCISQAVENSRIKASDIDHICGHLTSTFADKVEVRSWATALNRWGQDFPTINSLKSMMGHCMGAAGSIESVGAVLQLYHQFIHPSINCEDIHPEISSIIDSSCIPATKKEKVLNTVVKASFGFGDVNSCIVFSTT